MTLGILRLRGAALRLPGSALDDTSSGLASAHAQDAVIVAVGGCEDICANIFSSWTRGPANPAFAGKKFGMGLATSPSESRAFRNESGRNESSRSESGRNGPGSGL